MYYESNENYFNFQKEKDNIKKNKEEIIIDKELNNVIQKNIIESNAKSIENMKINSNIEQENNINYIKEQTNNIKNIFNF